MPLTNSQLSDAAEVVNVFLDNEQTLWVGKLQKLTWVTTLATSAKKKNGSEIAEMTAEWVADVPLFISESLQVGNFKRAYYDFIHKICAINPSEDDKASSDEYR